MSGFSLSPGITPELVGAFSIELPLALILAFVFFRVRGLQFAIAANTVALGAIKVYTDYPDPFDLLLAIAVVLTGVALTALFLAPRWRPSRPMVALALILGVYAVSFGAVKISLDPFDPFDLFLADMAVAGGVLLLHELLNHRTDLGHRPLPAIGALVGSAGGLLAVLYADWFWQIGWTWWFTLSVVPIGLIVFAFVRRRTPTPDSDRR